MKVKDITDIIEQTAPKESAYEWDNPALQIGSYNCEVKGILLCVDVSKEVIKEAIDKDINLIISHHPLFFSGIKHITDSDYKGRLVSDAIKNNLNIFSAHTNMDVAKEGLSVYMAKKLGLEEIAAIEDLSPKAFGLGAIGKYKNPITKEELLKKIKDEYKTSSLKVSSNDKKKIKKVALCTGSGSDLIDEVIRLNADCYITSDVKYHDFQKAYESGLCLVDTDHFDSEKCFVDLVYEKINKKYKDINMIKYSSSALTSFTEVFC